MPIVSGVLVIRKHVDSGFLAPSHFNAANLNLLLINTGL